MIRAREDGDITIRTRSGLRIDTSADHRSDVFAAFFDGYDRAFILPNEKEGVDGFRLCLELNEGDAYARLSSRFGVFREIVFVARDGDEIIGGANLIAFPLFTEDKRTMLSSNLNYVYVDADKRGAGYFRKLIEGLAEVIRALFDGVDGDAPCLTFFEQNDPYRMSAEDYARDTAQSGIDQFARVGIWTKLGARIVDFPYVQPPLSGDQEADETLAYGVLGATDTQLPAQILHDHLERFFGISVLKGREPMEDESAGSQLSALRVMKAQARDVMLLDPRGADTKRAGFNTLRDALRVLD